MFCQSRNLLRKIWRSMKVTTLDCGIHIIYFMNLYAAFHGWWRMYADIPMSTPKESQTILKSICFIWNSWNAFFENLHWLGKFSLGEIWYLRSSEPPHPSSQYAMPCEPHRGRTKETQNYLCKLDYVQSQSTGTGLQALLRRSDLLIGKTRKSKHRCVHSQL